MLLHCLDKRFFLTSIIIASCCIILIIQQQITWANDRQTIIMEGIKNKYTHLSGISISYTREIISSTMSMLGNQIKGDFASGIIYLKPPAFLKLEQKSPRQEIIITDGMAIWWYIPEDKCAYKYPARKYSKELSLLSDIFCRFSTLENDFNIKLLGTHQGKDKVELTPNPPWQEIEKIIITVTGRDVIRKIDIHNTFGSITSFKLKDLNGIKAFNKNFFYFTPPKGIKIIETLE